jgi:hypothetical protein
MSRGIEGEVKFYLHLLIDQLPEVGYMRSCDDLRRWDITDQALDTSIGRDMIDLDNLGDVFDLTGFEWDILS